MRAIAVKSFKSMPEMIDVPAPQPKQDEILVRLSVAGVNPFDWKVGEGMLDGQVPHTFPLVLGFDGAGTVGATGQVRSDLKLATRYLANFGRFRSGEAPTQSSVLSRRVGP